MKENNKKKKGNRNNSKNQTTKKATQKKETTKKVERNNQSNTKVEKIIVKEENKKETTQILNNSEVKNLLIIILVVTAIFLIFYGITTLVTKNKSNTNNKTNEEVAIQYDEILLGTLFEQTNTEYYVLISKEDDTYLSTYSNLISIYQTSEDSIRVYFANLDNGFNKNYKAEKSNISNNLKELKLSGTTLLKIKDKNIISSYEDNTVITAHLNSLLK